MATINTVLGPIDAEQLGHTLTHEHIVTFSGGFWQAYPGLLGDQNALRDLAVAAAREALDGGIKTLIDLTTVDLGRNVRFVAEVARQSGLQIIVATGAWRDVPRAFYSRTPDQVADLFVHDLTVGLDGTDIKAGIIKVANDMEGVTREAEVVLRAAARAARRTGARISTHTYAPGRVGEQQLAIFEDEGLDPNQVYIGHSNDSEDLDYLLGIVKRGAWLGLDRYRARDVGGSQIGPDWEGRTAVLAKLIEAGAGDRVMLSHDWGLISAHRTSDYGAARQRNPDGWLFISRNVLPRLRELGVDEAQIRRITVDTPRRFLTGEA